MLIDVECSISNKCFLKLLLLKVYVLQVEMHSFFRHFKLYLTSSTERFSKNFKVVVVDGKDEREYPVKWQDFFSGHVVGE